LQFEHTRGLRNVNPLFAGMILLLTIASAMALGVALGYGLFISILHLLGNQRQATAPELVHSEAISGGD